MSFHTARSHVTHVMLLTLFFIGPQMKHVGLIFAGSSWSDSVRFCQYREIFDICKVVIVVRSERYGLINDQESVLRKFRMYLWGELGCVVYKT